MSGATAKQAGIIAFVVGFALPSRLVLPSFAFGLTILAWVLMLSVFDMLRRTALELPGSGFLRAAFICGLASLVMTFAVPFIGGPLGLASWLGLLWPAAVLLLAVGLLRLHWVPAWMALLCGLWGLLAVARDATPLWTGPLPPVSETIIRFGPDTVGMLFWIAFGVALLAESKSTSDVTA